MRDPFLAGLTLSTLLFACGDGDKGQQFPFDAGPGAGVPQQPLPTAPSQPTAPTTPTPQNTVPAPCHPALQTGCQQGQKCAVVTSSGASVTRCVPGGTALAGQACAVDSTGADNCVAGYHCSGGTCKVICSQRATPLRCQATGGTCAKLPGLFDDVMNDRVGLCAALCDPLLQDCADAAAGCYLDIASGAASCAAVPAGAANHGQDVACYDGGTGTCQSNGCSAGFAPILPASFASNAPVCTQYCSPVDTHTAATGGAAGDPAVAACPSGYECRFVQSFFRNATTVPDTVGMCVSTAAWGTCTSCNRASRSTIFQTCFSQNAFGCLSNATLATIP